MKFTKDDLIAKLQELDINCSRYDHPRVLTVEAQAKHVGHLGGGLSKNIFLKDKKHRYYIISALVDTKIDLKVLSQRLGLGKGGLRMAPEETLGEILQVPIGCVTPFALINDSARDVSLLLDQGFKAQEYCFFHPLSNEVTISLNVKELGKFLTSIGKTPAYVDLEANPSVGKDQPPDLAALVPTGVIVVSPPEKAVTVKVPNENHAIVESKPKVATGKTINQSNKLVQNKKEKEMSKQPAATRCDVEEFINEFIEKTSSLVLSKITIESMQQHGDQLASVVTESFRKSLSSDMRSLATMFKNSAYTQGFHAGIQTVASAQTPASMRRCQRP